MKTNESVNNPDNEQLLLIALQAILTNTSAMMFVKDIDLIYRAVSPSFVRMAGKQSAEEILGHTDFEIFEDEELARRYVSDDRDLLTSGNDRVDFIEPLMDASGQPRYGSTSKYVLKDRTGRTIGIAGISRDVTLEYLANQNHQRELEYLFELPEDTYFAVFIDIDDWRMIAERRQSIGGYCFQPHQTMESLTKRACLHIVDRKAPAYAFYRSFSRDTLRAIYANGRRDTVMEYLRRMSDGTLRWVRDEIKFMVDPSNNHMCAMLIVRDIQAKKEEGRRTEPDLGSGTGRTDRFAEPRRHA